MRPEESSVEHGTLDNPVLSALRTRGYGKLRMQTPMKSSLGEEAPSCHFEEPGISMIRICVYSGSSFGASPVYAEAANAFGTVCAERGLGIVYGGGGVGLMGVLADAALAAGGEVIGVIPRTMIAEERAHRRLTELIAVDSMHERKMQMAELSDAFAALPGGIGTLEEVVEVFTWLQLGLHLKPVGLLNTNGFYEPLLKLLAHMRDEQFLTPDHHAMLSVEREPKALVDRLLATKHALIRKPIHTRDQ